MNIYRYGGLSKGWEQIGLKNFLGNGYRFAKVTLPRLYSSGLYSLRNFLVAVKYSHTMVRPSWIRVFPRYMDQGEMGVESLLCVRRNRVGELFGTIPRDSKSLFACTMPNELSHYIKKKFL